ncbi:hypothetical protein GCM10023084_59220 [Streptomyces lacrimifluminis]|uniref:Uncharacterized protein n=1 Tax=Streptomyces lacrimifluminis TaxID=1500077 RepID=A0A917LDZ6_9ACTN|nr:hypothetical protein GCM10012282_62170 [Streptomyces lacrimifluminis]
MASGRGAIVGIGSVNGVQSFGNHAYSAAKAGLTSLRRTGGDARAVFPGAGRRAGGHRGGLTAANTGFRRVTGPENGQETGAVTT